MSGSSLTLRMQPLTPPRVVAFSRARRTSFGRRESPLFSNGYCRTTSIKRIGKSSRDSASRATLVDADNRQFCCTSGRNLKSPYLERGRIHERDNEIDAIRVKRLTNIGLRWIGC